MEPNSNVGSYYHRHHQQQLHHHINQAPVPAPNPTPAPATTTTSTTANTNGIVSTKTNNSGGVYPHSVTAAVTSPLEGSVKRKRGRPRKYGTPEQAAAAKRLSVASASPRKSGNGGVAPHGSSSSATASYSSNKSHLPDFDNVGQAFSPHIITVAAGEDVCKKIMMFMQQSKREICVISASGSISNASLRQPATSGGNITYEGRFDILSLSGSYICTELRGRTGGLSVCLSSSDGQIIGGGVGGPLTAAGSIQVIICTFLIDTKKGIKGDSASGQLLPPLGGCVSQSGLNFQSPGGSPHQTGSGSPFLIQHRSGMQQMATAPQSMEWRSNASHMVHQSPENGDYEPISD